MDELEREEERHRRRIMLMRMQGDLNRRKHRRDMMVAAAATLLFLAITLGPMIAHGAEDPYACFGAGRYDAMRDGRECPAKPKVAWYCRPLVGLERSCTSVKAMVKTLGAARAEKLARKCGATDSDIEQAKTCLSQ